MKDRKIDFKKIESKWQKNWEKESLYRVVDGDKKREKKYVLVEFPYPSGSGLHVGHAFTMTGADVYARKKRMEGNNVLFPMGWDAFGLPTENYAIRTGIKPQLATEQNTANYRRQMKKMAFSFDWQREVNTTDPTYYKWTQWIFIQLFKHGLAYKKEMPINWCPSCKTGLANEEVIDGKCERCGAGVSRRNLSQWIVKITDYADRLLEGLEKTAFIEKVKAAQINWIGKTQGVTIDYPVMGMEKTISCYSTRPDTNFGATFIVIAPEHEMVMELTTEKNEKAVREYIKQAKKKSELERTELEKEKTGVFTGSYALNRLTGKKMPIYVSDFVVLTAGTGIVVGVPAHDERDFQFAKKYRLEITPVVKPKGGKKWDFNKRPFANTDKAVVFNSRFLNGLPALEAKEKIIDYLVKKGWGKRAINYHLRDWIFSRQHYWGEPIPMIYCEKCGWQPVPEDQLPVKLPDVEKYQPTDTGESPLANIKDWVETKCPKCEGKARRETDTMPNWAGSDWYFLRYIDPKNKKAIADMEKMKYWLPVDIYIGGDEHNTLHLLYSRFIYQFLHDIGAVPKKYSEPYYKRLSHGVILGSDGFRMSKSRGNVVNPDEIWEKHGVDALRMYMMFMGPFEGTMVWNENALRGIERFLKRFDRGTRWLINQAKSHELKCVPAENNTEFLPELHKTIKKVGGDVDKCQFNTAIAALMTFLNFIHNEVIKESVKPLDKRADHRYFISKKGNLKKIIQLLAPFAPYLAEELWEKLGEKNSVHISEWPEFDPKYLVEDETEIVVQINGKLRGTVRLNSKTAKSESEAVKKAKDNFKVAKYLEDKQIVKTIFVPGKLINFVIKQNA